MFDLQLFLPCGAGIEPLLHAEVLRIAKIAGSNGLAAHEQRGGVVVRGASWRDVLHFNLHSRLASRVLVQLSHTPYREEADLYAAAKAVVWEAWFHKEQTFKVELTAQASPLQSLNFATLKIKDAVCDRFRERQGDRPSVETQWPQVRIYGHVTRDQLTLYIDTSGEPLFKRGWREDKGEAPLKETLAAAMLEASGWAQAARDAHAAGTPAPVLYDPCCGSGTIAIEAAQIATGVPSGSLRRFGFERLMPHQAHIWDAIKTGAALALPTAQNSENALQKPRIFGSDVAFRMMDFAQRNAERAGVAEWVDFRGGDALQRTPPVELAECELGVVMVNPPYGERIESGGVQGGEAADGAFFTGLAAHWKNHFGGWTAWVLSPDPRLPGQMRMKENRRVVLFNGPIECRMFRFELRAKQSAGPARDTVGPSGV